MSAAAFNVRHDRVQEATGALGIEGVVHINLVSAEDVNSEESFAWTWLGCDRGASDPIDIFIRRDLHPEFASFCLWHELRHAWQVQREYAGEQGDFLTDYQRAAGAVGITVSSTGFLEVWPWNRRAYALLPWECDANLCAWESRMTLLTKRGRGRHTFGPQGSWWFFREMDLDLHEIIDLGNQYREGVRE